jgi:hypothetical protein
VLHRLALRPRRNWVLAAGLALALSYAWPMQGGGNAQNSQYALIKALASGTPTIDRTRYETGDIATNDIVHFRGHVYSNKAPGLAFVALPAYIVLRAAGVSTTGDPTRMLWALGLCGVVLPGVLLVLLVRAVAEAMEPGFGTITAVALGVGTLILPFATIFYAHVLAAFLAFAAFAVLWHERRGPSRLSVVFLGGVVAGLAVTAENADGIIVAVLLLYAASRAVLFRRALTYTAGILVGVVPLLAYNWWAFGSIVRFSYLIGAGGDLAGHPHPSLLVMLQSLVSRTGLLTLAPVLIAGFAGTVILYRRGSRAEALVIVGTTALMVLYVSSFGPSFGGYSPGPRYLIPALPFLVLPVALSFRVVPLTTAALCLISAVLMTTITSTYVLAAYDGRWFHRAALREFVLTAESLVGLTGWYSVLAFFAACAFAIAGAFKATSRPRLRPAEAACAGVAVAGWFLLKATAPTGSAGGYGGFSLAGLGVLTVVAALVLATGFLRDIQPARSGQDDKLA